MTRNLKSIIYIRRNKFLPQGKLKRYRSTYTVNNFLYLALLASQEHFFFYSYGYSAKYKLILNGVKINNLQKHLILCNKS